MNSTDLIMASAKAPARDIRSNAPRLIAGKWLGKQVREHPPARRAPRVLSLKLLHDRRPLKGKVNGMAYPDDNLAEVPLEVVLGLYFGDVFKQCEESGMLVPFVACAQRHRSPDEREE
jgi:hypothetical protein